MSEISLNFPLEILLKIKIHLKIIVVILLDYIHSICLLRDVSEFLKIWIFFFKKYFFIFWRRVWLTVGESGKCCKKWRWFHIIEHHFVPFGTIKKLFTKHGFFLIYTFFSIIEPLWNVKPMADVWPNIKNVSYSIIIIKCVIAYNPDNY